MAGAIGKFLLNAELPADKQVVDAPAFSITKVLASAGIIVGPIATLIADNLLNIDFSAWQLVSLAAALLLFLAILASADVVARSIATGAKAKADGEVSSAKAAAEATTKAAKHMAEAAKEEARQAGMGRIVVFDRPIQSMRRNDKGGKFNVAVDAHAICYGDTCYVAISDPEGHDGFRWVPKQDVAINS
jgi:hypothetical protein